MANRSSDGSLLGGRRSCVPRARWSLVARSRPPRRRDQSAADATSKRAAERIRALQNESDALATQERTLLVDLRKLEVDRRAEDRRSWPASSATCADARDRSPRRVARAAALQDSADTERPEVERRLVELYKLGRAGYWRLLLDVDDLRSIGARLSDRRGAQPPRSRTGAAAQRTLAGARARAGRTRGASQGCDAACRDRRVAARAAASIAPWRPARRSSRRSTQRRDLNAQLAGELEAAQQRLQGTVAQLGGRGGAGHAAARARFAGRCRGRRQGIVTGRFGAPDRQPVRHPHRTQRHRDLLAPKDRPVRAVHEGTVAYADQFTGYGNLVIVDHGDSAYSLYGYLSSLDVARGDRVDAQAPVGASGRDPSGNPALYFELRIDGKPVDPLQWLEAEAEPSARFHRTELMTSKTRLSVLLLSTPVLIFVVVGGLMGKRLGHQRRRHLSGTCGCSRTCCGWC